MLKGGEGYNLFCICLASSGRNAFEFTLSPSRGVGLPTKRSATRKIVAIFRVPSGDAGLAASTPSVSKMLNKYDSFGSLSPIHIEQYLLTTGQR